MTEVVKVKVKRGFKSRVFSLL